MADRLRAILNHCRSSGSRSAFFRFGNYTGIINLDRFENVGALQKELAAFDAAPVEALCKNSASIRAAVIGDLFFKCYRKRGITMLLKRAILLPRPFRCLGAAIRLKEIGVSTPKVWAAVRCRSYYFFPQMDYLVTEALAPNCASLAKLVPESPVAIDPVLLGGLVKLAAKLHEAGVVHGDLSLRNIYAERNADGSIGSFGVIDLDALTAEDRPAPVNFRRRELARLVSSYQDLRSFHYKETAELAELTAEAARLYQEETGIDLASPALTDRVNYLYRRKLRSLPR